MILDPQQRAAVLSPHRNTLVLAGAGSGKTRVLVSRIIHLIKHERVSPYEIMALTFTRKAANEMQQRIRREYGAVPVKVGTIHALALKFIRMYGDSIGYRPNRMTVYSEWEENFLRKDTCGIVSAKIGDAVAIDAYYQTGLEPKPDTIERRLFDVFLSRLRQYNSMTYGMLLVTMKKLIPVIVGRAISHILVDEAQDLDRLQWGILRAFQDERPSCTIFAVGDQDQSIYEWRGAFPEYLTWIAAGATGRVFEVFKLETNYRSTPEIVKHAANLITHNKKRIEKSMRPFRDDNGLVSILEECDSKRLADAIVSIQAKRPNDQIAVLSRTHVLISKLSRVLADRSIEHHYCGQTRSVMDSESFRRTHAVFKLMKNPADDFSFSVARPFFRVENSEFAAIVNQSLERQVSHFETWADNSGMGERLFGGRIAEKPLGEIIARIDRVLGFEFDISMSLRIAQKCAENGMTLEEYLDFVTTFDLQDDVAPAHKAGIQLMTIHAAKGLEFPIVIIAGVNEGILPIKQAMSIGEFEEERRLAYVAMTRAEDWLFITSRPEVTGAKGQFKNPISRFIGETEVKNVRQ
jgi:DNA helicase-2/ATP-dependent DNA helicase PcrA